MAADDDDGCRFGHHCRRNASDYIKIREVDRNKLFTTLIYDFLLKFFIHGLNQPLFRVARTFGHVDSSNPRRWRGERIRHHGCVCCVFVLCVPVSSGRRHSSTRWLTRYLVPAPHWLAPCQNVVCTFCTRRRSFGYCLKKNLKKR